MGQPTPWPGACPSPVCVVEPTTDGQRSRTTDQAVGGVGTITRRQVTSTSRGTRPGRRGGRDEGWWLFVVATQRTAFPLRCWKAVLGDSKTQLDTSPKMTWSNRNVACYRIFYPAGIPRRIYPVPKRENLRSIIWIWLWMNPLLL